MDSHSEIASLRQVQIGVSEHHIVRRSRMETICEVLHVIESGATKITHIMYRANLSWKVMNELLEMVEKQGFVVTSSQQGKVVYNLTDKGRALLHQYSQIRDELSFEI